MMWVRIRETCIWVTSITSPIALGLVLEEAQANDPAVPPVEVGEAGSRRIRASATTRSLSSLTN